jgi:mannose-6-phosphate isomerase class I
LLLLLLQVLSIDRALPLQAHPTSSTAKKLHQKDPEVRIC